MTFAEAQPAIIALGENVPEELRHSSMEPGRHWVAWMERRDRTIRARIAWGDEDSVVNLMLYGIGFTRRARAIPGAIGASSSAAQIAEVMDGRLEDLAKAVESPSGDPRVAFARQVIERQGITVGPRARDSVRGYLHALRSRVLADNERYAWTAATASAAGESERRAAHATLYHDRGLSTDTSLRVDFAVEQALGAVLERRALTGRVERAAVVGPGLDFVDKAQGHDWYPVQMIQPFALADSLMRVGLADGPAITALDISARVLDHLREARQRARLGAAYRLNLILENDAPDRVADEELVAYWRRAGDRLGAAGPARVPARIHDVRARAIDVRPDAVLAVEAVDLNIVVDRLATPDAASGFDLVVATNVLVYYEPFEQALAATNMAGMLRAGGLLLTNQPVPLPAASGLSPVLIMSVALDTVRSGAGSHQRGDTIYVYRKA